MADDAAELASAKSEVSHGSILGTTRNALIKRRDWSQYILQSLPDFLHVLDADTKIRYASPSCKTITGHEPAEMVGRRVINFIHPDDNDLFTKELDGSKTYSKTSRFFYRFLHTNQTWVIIESRVQWYLGDQAKQEMFPPQCCISDRGYLIMARPYQNKTAPLFDSFLELKMENERLVKRLAELKQEELEDEAEMLRLAKSNETSRDGQQNHGIAASLKDCGGAKIGDAGILLPTCYPNNNGDASMWRPKKAKKSKVSEMPKCRICTVCGVSDAPEWRFGPDGPKTLCNACGLRWAKSKRRAMSKEMELHKASK